MQRWRQSLLRRHSNLSDGKRFWLNDGKRFWCYLRGEMPHTMLASPLPPLNRHADRRQVRPGRVAGFVAMVSTTKAALDQSIATCRLRLIAR